MKEASISTYADDHQVYVVGDSRQNLIKNLVKDGEMLTQWSNDNLPQVDCDKYQCMLIGIKNTKRTINFVIDGEHKEQTQSIKILGEQINEKLTFGLHISEICKRVSKQIGVLNRLKNLIPTCAKLRLFKSVIILHLTCCHLEWHFSRASDWLQERALRAVFNDASDSYGTILQKAK